ncbi:MAG: DUF4838 domain-containing protein [Actinobacteria bacterium]|nr:DUF4838 domain-containing protein [Actinomycetota bacterium]
MPLSTRLARRGALIWSVDFDDHALDVATRAGTTTLGLHPIPEAPAEDDLSLESMLRQIREPEFRRLADGARSRGIDLEFEFHAMNVLLPRAEFADHPEWFRMNDRGERTAQLNLCPSNPDALETVAGNSGWLVEQLAEFSTHRYFFWTDDNGDYCHCAPCSQLSPSDQALTIYNHILRGVRRVDPLGTVAYLAYQATLPAPVNVRPEEGIFLEYAPIDRDSRFALSDDRRPMNVTERGALPGLIAYFGVAEAQALDYWFGQLSLLRVEASVRRAALVSRRDAG